MPEKVTATCSLITIKACQQPAFCWTGMQQAKQGFNPEQKHESVRKHKLWGAARVLTTYKSTPKCLPGFSPVQKHESIRRHNPREGDPQVLTTYNSTLHCLPGGGSYQYYLGYNCQHTHFPVSGTCLKHD